MKKGDKYATGYIEPRERRTNMVEGLCSLCRVNQSHAMHHLIPRAMSRDRGETGCLIPVCRPCHIFIHKAFSHIELATKYDTAKKLKANYLVQQFNILIQERAIGKKIKGKRIFVRGGLVFLKTGSSYRTAGEQVHSFNSILE